jgi:tRNA(fMet)-specific endonuclease VapC
VGAHPVGELATTVLSVEEQLSGWYTQVRKAKGHARLALAYARLAKAVRFLSAIQILDFDEPAIQRYEQLCKAKVRIGKTDLRIAAVVQQHGATLVTRNVRDFSQIPGLQIEDWSV